MTIGNSVRSSTLVKVALVLWLVSTGLVMLMLGQIDSIVHHDLYDYGLQFSLNWASPYWGSLRMIYVFLAVPSIVGGAVLTLSILKGRGGGYYPRPVVKPISAKTQASAENHLLASCPNCKKVFSKPLTMLDFTRGTTRLINVCPYCNHVLGSADGEKELNDVGLADREEEVTH